MYEKPLEEKLDEIISMIRVLDTKIIFLQEDINTIRDDELQKVRVCVEQLARKDLDDVAREEAAKFKVERF